MTGLSRKQRARLADLLGDPPDLANVPESFWRDVELDRQRTIAEFALLVFLLSARLHGATDKDAAKDAASEYAKKRAPRVGRDFMANSREKLEARAREWEERRRKAAEDDRIVPPGKADAKEAVDAIFAPSRDESISITETTQATSAGGEWAVNQGGGESRDDLWITENDAKVCPICQPLHREPRAVWSGKFPDGPPGHPRCRCFIEYAVAAAELAKT